MGSPADKDATPPSATPKPPGAGPPTAYWAHSANDRGQWHDLREHLQSVAALARQFADPFGAGDWAHTAGLWHDLGKYLPAFQKYLAAAGSPGSHNGELRGSVDHASAGAQHAVFAIPVLGHLLAYVVAGHHTGLPDAINEGPCLEKRLRKTLEPFQPPDPSLLASPHLELPTFLRESLARRTSDRQKTAFTFAFFVRMLFSCLVDADFLDTEAFLEPQRSAQRPRWPPDVLARMEAALDSFVALFPDNANPVDQYRQQVRRWCRAAASERPGFFSLTVPTGGGKTLSSFAFALRHAQLHGLSRIIYVLPFTSIIEQNVEVFRRVLAPLTNAGLPDPVLEHHSALGEDKETLASRLAAENWDAPLIVTTSVQFYESLFASRASRCRKLHNLAKAVVILDEAQKIPVDYLAPCLLALQELISHYSTSVVLCTATQPAVHKREDFPIGLQEVREIIPNPPQLFLALKRVSVHYLGELNDDEIASRLTEEIQALCIVNTRRQARILASHEAHRTNTFHLSGSMCAAHRSEIIGHVRELLAAGEPCRVISTQLVEAGVDLDFPIVFRSLAGLDSLAQAAGRCNRNGRIPTGLLYLFRSSHSTRESFLRDTINATVQLLGCDNARHLYDDLFSLSAVEHYFRLYYWEQSQRWDAHRILDGFTLTNDRNLPFLFSFQKVAMAFRLLEDSGRPVIIPWRDRGSQLCEDLRRSWGTPDWRLLRALQRYTVQVPTRLWEREVGRAIELVHDQFPVLTSPSVYYCERIGLLFDETEIDADSLII